MDNYFWAAGKAADEKRADRSITALVYPVKTDAPQPDFVVRFFPPNCLQNPYLPTATGNHAAGDHVRFSRMDQALSALVEMGFSQEEIKVET